MTKDPLHNFLQNLVKKVDNAATKDDLLETYKKILRLTKSLKTSNNEQLSQGLRSINAHLQRLDKEAEKHQVESKSAVDAALKEHALAVKNRLATVKDGKTPIAGVDYRIPADGAPGIPGRNASPPTEEELLALLLPLVEQLEQRINDKISKLPRTGGARSSHSTRFTDLSSHTNGVLKVFAVPEGLGGVLFSSDFPMVLMENNGFTLNKSRTQLTMTTDNAPSAGSQLLYQSIDVSNAYG